MRHRILVVDDTPYVADAYARLISICGYETRAVYSGLDAIEQTRDFQPDMALMDICMPDLDGYETARRIRLDQRNAHVVLVAVTCLAQSDDQRRAYESGFNLHVAKPVGLTTLYGVLALLQRDTNRAMMPHARNPEMAHGMETIEREAGVVMPSASTE